MFTVSIYTVNAQGNITRRTAFSSTALPTSLTAAPLTGNGVDDLIAANALDNSVTVALQMPGGEFASPLTLPAGVAPSDIAIADANGDGLPDIIVSDQASGDVTVLLNDPAHDFKESLRYRASTEPYGLNATSSIPTVNSFVQSVSLVVGDFTGSGRNDLAVVNQATHSFTILAALGDGGYANPQLGLVTSTSEPQSINERPDAIVAGDFNRDGRTDLAVLMEDTGEIWIYTNQGNGTFRHTFSIPVGEEATGLAVVPGSAPGLLDLLVGNGFGDVLHLAGKGDGTFQISGNRVSLDVVPNLLGPGLPGVLVGNQQNNQVTIQSPTSGGNQFAPVQTLGGSGTGSQLAPGDVQWAVLDQGASLPDAIVVSSGSNSVVVYRTTAVKNGAIAFAPKPQTLFVGTDPVSVTVTDLNGDGVPDLLVANQGSNDVSVIFGSYNASGDWVGTLGPRLKSGGDGPIAASVQDLTGNGVPDLAVFNGGSGTVTELPGVGLGFFDDRQPRTLVNFGSALVQPPTFVGTTGLGYEVTAGGDLVRFSLLSPGGGDFVFSGQQVVAAQAVASGQVVVALADGGVDLLAPQGDVLAIESVLQAQGGLPALPSAIQVVNKPGGQLNVLVSSEGSDNIFVFAQVESASEGGGGALPGAAAAPALNLVQTPTLASASASSAFTLTSSAIATSASAAATSTSASTSSSSSAVAATVTTSVGLSLGSFSSLGNRSSSDSGGTVLVAVEGNTYLSVPILDFGTANTAEEGAGEARMPWLSGMHNFGDTSELTRFVIGLDEALRRYRGAEENSPFSGQGQLKDPWSEDLFHQHLPVLPPQNEPSQNDPQAMLFAAATEPLACEAGSHASGERAASRTSCWDGVQTERGVLGRGWADVCDCCAPGLGRVRRREGTRARLAGSTRTRNLIFGRRLSCLLASPSDER